MSHPADLLQRESHFAFGKNWASYADGAGELEINEAVIGLKRLIGADLRGKRVLDIGCGSGIHALAALRLGAAEVVSIDIDPDCVDTAQRLLSRKAPNEHWTVLEKSVFDLEFDSLGAFDVVYSWGVLHHTGDMRRAIEVAASAVRPGGMFVFALYRRTRMCWFWRAEKRWYAQASPRMQALARAMYVLYVRLLYPLLSGQTFRSYVEEYRRANRGMDFRHDVHDWLGGWPYESISPQRVEACMRDLGLKNVRSFAHERTPSGLFGSFCDEYVYWRPQSAAAIIAPALS